METHGKNAPCWAFYVVNDNTQVDGKVFQVMHCMICHTKNVPFIAKTKFIKKTISCLKTNGITIFKKYVDVEYILIAKKFEEEISSLVRSGLEKQLAKRRPNVSTNEIFEFFSIKDPFKKDDVQQK